MSRPLRVNIADGWYHVMARGIDRHALFTDNIDHEHFLELLGHAVERYRVRIHAYALMSNHYHLMVQTPDANLSAVMQWINISYSVWFNKRHNRIGPLFAGRFKDVPIEDSQWAYELSVYIHLNPVRINAYGFGRVDRLTRNVGVGRDISKAEVLRILKALRSYKWSSYRGYAGYVEPVKWLTEK